MLFFCSGYGFHEAGLKAIKYYSVLISLGLRIDNVINYRLVEKGVE